MPIVCTLLYLLLPPVSGILLSIVVRHLRTDCVSARFSTGLSAWDVPRLEEIVFTCITARAAYELMQLQDIGLYLELSCHRDPAAA